MLRAQLDQEPLTSVPLLLHGSAIHRAPSIPTGPCAHRQPRPNARSPPKPSAARTARRCVRIRNIRLLANRPVLWSGGFRTERQRNAQPARPPARRFPLRRQLDRRRRHAPARGSSVNRRQRQQELPLRRLRGRAFRRRLREPWTPERPRRARQRYGLHQRLRCLRTGLRQPRRASRGRCRNARQLGRRVEVRNQRQSGRRRQRRSARQLRCSRGLRPAPSRGQRLIGARPDGWTEFLGISPESRNWRYPAGSGALPRSRRCPEPRCHS